MLCENCNIDRSDNDFVNNQKYCYHCMYLIKMSNDSQVRKHKSSHCRNCGKAVIKKEHVRKRQRTIFCSKECAEEGHKEQLSNHWTRQVKSFTP